MTARQRWRRPAVATAGVTALVMGGALAVLTPAQARPEQPTGAATATPVKHLVVVFDENVSFDHYFGTYPHAANTDGTPFHPRRGTPQVNGLRRHRLLHHNPNHFAVGSRANPHRLSHAQAVTCDQDHGYTAEQQAYHGGAMDQFVQ